MTTLVLIPGLGSDAAVWNRTIAALGGAFPALVADTHQASSLIGMAHDILAAAPPTFVLAGVSMGGMVAMEIMRLAPERVQALALLDTNARPDTEAQKARRSAVNAAMLAADDIRALTGPSLDYLVHSSAPASVREELADMGVRVGAETYVRQNTAVAARADLRPVLPTIAVPTLVICGAQDQMTPLELSEEIHSLIPNAALHVLPDCGHLPPIEKPETVSNLLKSLVAKL